MGTDDVQDHERAEGGVRDVLRGVEPRQEVRFDVHDEERIIDRVDNVNRARGCDVNHYHPLVNASVMYDAGYSFVGMKATQGLTYVDPTFTSNRAAARSQPFDLLVHYHFCAPGDPIAQAEHFMDVVGSLRGNERLAFDLEDDKTGKPAVDIVWTTAFVTRLLGGVCTDRRLINYTSRRVWLQLGNPQWDLASETDLWLPRYGPDEPEIPSPWKALGRTWSFWQNSEDAVVPGVAGPCDASLFNGDVAALRAYVALSPVMPQVA